MIYNVGDKLPLKKLILFSIQLMLSCFTATVLIASICGGSVSGALVGAGMSTLIYAVVTRFESPMYISNSGAFVVPVLAALAAGGYSAVAIGGLISAIVYSIFGIIFTKISVHNIYKVLPKVLIGSITVVIGVTLMAFIPTYIGDTGNVGIIIALITMLSIALCSHYCKGALSLLPFLIGTLIGYVVSIPFGLVDFTVFNNISIISIPDFAFSHWESINWVNIIGIMILYIAFTVSAICECLSDHAALGAIIGKDLYNNPGLGKIFFGEGLANIASSCLGGLGACSYGESIATIGFSKCGAVSSTLGAAALMIIMGCFEPVQAFINSIPSCVIGGGTAMILYGFIANSGIKQLQQVDFSNQKNLIICSVVMSIGISGIAIGGSTFSLSGTALALVAGIILNIVLKEKRENV